MLKNCITRLIKYNNLIPTNIFWHRNHLRGVRVRLFLDNCYLLTWNLVYILSNWKIFKIAIKNFWIWHDTSYWGHHTSAFSAGSLAFTVCRFFYLFSNFSFILSLLFGILRASMSFHFSLNICYGNILPHFGLEGFKIHKI